MGFKSQQIATIVNMSYASKNKKSTKIKIIFIGLCIQICFAPLTHLPRFILQIWERCSFRFAFRSALFVAFRLVSGHCIDFEKQKFGFDLNVSLYFINALKISLCMNNSFSRSIQSRFANSIDTRFTCWKELILQKYVPIYDLLCSVELICVWIEMTLQKHVNNVEWRSFKIVYPGKKILLKLKLRILQSEIRWKHWMISISMPNVPTRKWKTWIHKIC